MRERADRTGWCGCVTAIVMLTSNAGPGRALCWGMKTQLLVARVGVCSFAWGAAWLMAPGLGMAQEGLGGPPASGQPSGQSPGLQGPGAGVTRADLAEAYLRFERAVREHPVPESKLKDVNKAFDTATMAFFGGNFGGAIAKLNETMARLVSGGDDKRSLARRAAEAMKVQLEPAVMVAGPQGGKVSVATNAFYALQAEELAGKEGAMAPVKLRVRLVAGEGAKDAPQEVVELVVDPTAKEPITSARKEMPAWAKARPGRYEVVIDVPGEDPVKKGFWTVMERKPSAIREANEARLNGLKATDGADGGFADAVRTCRARNAVLVDVPSVTKSAEFLCDPFARAAEIKLEIDALAKKQDPYKMKPGDWWAGIAIPGREIPCRIYAPPTLCKAGAPVAALVVALHGAGGDESMFMDGYGAGEIKRLAEAQGFLVIAPLTNVVQNNPAHFDAVVNAMKRWYNVDSDRVYVVGHSMGAGAAATLASVRSSSIAAAACLAGGPFRDLEGTAAPILIIAGEIDPLFPPARAKGIVEKAQKNGFVIELRSVKDTGHTLLVGSKLGEAVEWLMGRTLSDPKPVKVEEKKEGDGK